MNAIKQLLTALFACSLIATIGHAGENSNWHTDVESGLAQAKKQNKAVMVEFTGSDWCPPCMMMNQKVFSQAAFTSAAEKNYVLVVIDIPRANEELAEENSKVAEQYKVKGYPTVVLLDKDGKKFNHFIATEHPSVPQFLAHLSSALEKKDMN